MTDTSLTMRQLAPVDFHLADRFYDTTSYHSRCSAHELVFVAEDAGRVVGVVRLEPVEDVQVLRGMYLAEDYQGRGVGSALLQFIRPWLDRKPAMCLPFDHLGAFYATVGFQPVQVSELPAVMQQRDAHYRSQGHRIMAMVRQVNADRAGHDMAQVEAG